MLNLLVICRDIGWKAVYLRGFNLQPTSPCLDGYSYAHIRFVDANISIKIIQWYKSGANLTFFKIKAV